MKGCFNVWGSLKARWVIKPPWWMRIGFPGTIWRYSVGEKVVYLTFDDGPIPEVTPQVVSILKKHNARATFFCVGDNIRKYPEVFALLKKEGMAVGNHSYSHIKAWKSQKEDYFEDIARCQNIMETKIFRPPYGQLYPWYIARLKKTFEKIIMWDILSKDYDQNLSSHKVTMNVIQNIRPGSIIVFHDSEKAWPRLKHALPEVLNHLKKEGYSTGLIE